MPKMVDRLTKDALNDKTHPKVVLDIMHFLIELAQTQMATVQDPGDIERGFISKPRSFEPLDIVKD